MAFTIKGMDLSGYMFKDGARSIAFYRDVLGLQPTTAYPEDQGAEFEFADGTTFGLWGGGGILEFQPSNGILFSVDDVDAATADLKAKGIPILREIDTPVCKMVMINDPDGNLVTLHKRK